MKKIYRKSHNQSGYASIADLATCSKSVVSLDVETTGLKWWADDLIGLGFYCPDRNISGYIPTLDSYDRIELKRALPKILSPGTAVIAHNAKFDLHFLDAAPKKTGWKILDTMVMIHLLDSRYPKGAEQAEQIFLGTDTKKQHLDRQPKLSRKKIWTWSTSDTADYCINDARVEYEFAKYFLPYLEDYDLWNLFVKEMEYLSVIYTVEEQGIGLDADFVEEAMVSLLATQTKLEEILFESVGYKFNWRSHKQLSQALYEDMNFPRPENPFTLSRFNKDRGKYNSTLTSTFILMEKAKHPLGELMSTIREAAKLHNYLEGWLKLVDKDGRLHSTFNQTGTRTGRLSSREPNLQNVPSEFRNRFTQAVFTGSVERSEEYNLRNALVARPGYSFVSVDYKQMEMRMFGILSGDPFMLDSLAAGRDIHADIAEAVWGSRDPVHREWAKTISFGLIYGMTTGSLQFKLELTREKAEDITNQYWKTFPRIRPWLYGTADECRQNGYVIYWSGRRWVEDDEMSYFKAANALIQGGCADVLSVAAIRVDDYLENDLGVGHIADLVHDELITEVPDELVPVVAKNQSEIMQVPDLFNIAWLTDIKVGKTYGSLQKYELGALTDGKKKQK